MQSPGQSDTPVSYTTTTSASRTTRTTTIIETVFVSADATLSESVIPITSTDGVILAIPTAALGDANLSRDPQATVMDKAGEQEYEFPWTLRPTFATYCEPVKRIHEGNEVDWCDPVTRQLYMVEDRVPSSAPALRTWT